LNEELSNVLNIQSSDIGWGVVLDKGMQLIWSLYSKESTLLNSSFSSSKFSSAYSSVLGLSL
jgi:hypothetical protein